MFASCCSHSCSIYTGSIRRPAGAPGDRGSCVRQIILLFCGVPNGTTVSQPTPCTTRFAVGERGERAANSPVRKIIALPQATVRITTYNFATSAENKKSLKKQHLFCDLPLFSQNQHTGTLQPECRWSAPGIYTRNNTCPQRSTQ